MIEGIDVVIVNYYSIEKLKNLLRSIDTTGIDVSIIVVSNSSENELYELKKCNNIQLVINEKNRGFAYACNRALPFCKHSYILLLNPDTILQRNTLADSFHFMQANKEVTVLGVQHLNEEGKTAASCSRFPRLRNFLYEIMGLNKISTYFKGASLMFEWDHSESRFVDQVMGAFMMIRKEFTDKQGLMDERFFMFYEDMDFCKRVHMNGGRIYYNAAIKIMHEGSKSTENVSGRKLGYILRSRLKYTEKYFGRFKYGILFLTMILVEPFTRLLFAILKGDRKKIKDTLEAYQLFFSGNNFR